MYDYGYGYSTPDSSTVSLLAGGIAGFGAIMMIGSLVLSILLIVSQWKIYKKAGKKGWECIIPIYNIIVLLEIVQLPIWYIALFFVPFANIYAMFKIYIELAHKFGKSTGFGVATVFFNIICFPILAFSKNCVYVGNTNNTQMNNNMQNIQPQNNNEISYQNNFNNMPNDSMNNENQEPLFNQNVNTQINQIQPEVNNNMIEQQPPVTQIFEQQSETNVVMNGIPTVETIGTVNQNNSNQQPIQPELSVNETATTLISDTQPTLNGNDTNNIIPNTNPQPATPQESINVVPNIGIMPQVEVPNQNNMNNQNNSNIQ